MCLFNLFGLDVDYMGPIVLGVSSSDILKLIGWLQLSNYELHWLFKLSSLPHQHHVGYKCCLAIFICSN